MRIETRCVPIAPSSFDEGGSGVGHHDVPRRRGSGQLEQLAAQNQDVLRGISDRAKEHGVIAHRFYGSDGQIMVVDEWPDAASFQQFFEQERSTIEPMMAEVATGEPEVTFWRKLETHDEIGWD